MYLKKIMAATFAATALAGQAQEKTFSIIPEPVEITVTGQGEYLIQRNTVIRMSEPTLALSATYLADYMERYLGIPLQVDLPKSGKSRKKLSSAVETILSKPGDQPCIILKNQKNGEIPGGYQLEITPVGGVRIEGNDEAGVFYGVQTLIQLLPTRAGVLPILPTLKIIDYPRFPYRGMHLDVVRHFFPVDFIKKYIDYLALHKLNYFHWHLTDDQGWRIEIKKYPLLTKVGSKGNYHDPSAPAAFYTQEDIKDIVAYAAARHIMIVPEFDMPGHATAACRAYPELSGGGEGRWKDFTFHPCKEETFRFISDVLDELITLFPSPYIHIGGDEVHFGNQEWFTDPQIQQFIKDKQLMNETGLEQYFVRRVADIIAAKGKTMIGWDEIVDAGVSPDKAVVMWWRHDRRYQLLKALESGYRVIMTPRRPMYGDFVQYSTHNVGRYWDGYNPIEDVFSFPRSIEHLFKGYESQIMGMQYSLWTERVADVKRLDFMVFPRLIALAEAAWTPAGRKDYSRFMRRLPFFLHWLDTKDIYYFDPFAPERRPEPTAPEKEDVLQNG